MADVNKTINVKIKADGSSLKNTSKSTGVSLRKMGEDAKKAKKDMSDMSKGLSRAKDAMKAAAAGVAKLGAAVAGAAVAFVAIQQKIANMVNDLSDASSKTGIAIETLQGLKLAAESSGLQLNSMIGGLIRFQSSISMAAKGTGIQAEAFAKLGVNVQDANGDLRESNDVFNDTISALSEMEAGTERNVEVINLFGRSAGAALIQSGAIDNMALYNEKVREFGLDTGPAAREEAARWQRAVADLSMVTERAGQDMVVALTGANSPASAMEKLGGAMVFLKTIALDVFSAIRSSISLVQSILQGLVNTIMAMKFTPIFDKFNKWINTPKKQGQTWSDYVSDLGKNWDNFGKEIDKVSGKWLKLTKPESNQFETSISNLGNTFSRASKQYEKFMSMTNISGGGGGRARGRSRGGGSGGSGGGAAKERKDNIAGLQKEISLIMQTDKNYEKVLNKSQKITLKYDQQIERLKKIQEESKGRLKTEEEQKELQLRKIKDVFVADAEYAQKIQDMKKEHAKELERLDKERFKRLTDNIKGYGLALTGYFSSFTTAIGTTIENTGNMTEQNAKNIHRMNQGIGISEVIINQAVAVMKAMSTLGPVFGPLAATGLTALGAAQIAAIASAPPPSFHMGGMVGGEAAPDTFQARLLSGEAVLDRSTVNRVGGARGVQKLKNGMSQDVIVVNSFRHFGKFVSASTKRNSRLRSLTSASTGRRKR